MSALPVPDPDSPTLQTIVVKVENKFGLLARVADLFARRGYNIDSLAVAPTHNPAFSRITIVVQLGSVSVDQIRKQLDKLVHVVEIDVPEPGAAVERELLMATVKADHTTRSQIVELVDIFEGKILAVSSDQLTVSLDGKPDKIDDFKALLEDFDITEMHRSGRIALPKIGRTGPELAVV